MSTKRLFAVLALASSLGLARHAEAAEPDDPQPRYQPVPQYAPQPPYPRPAPYQSQYPYPYPPPEPPPQYQYPPPYPYSPQLAYPPRPRPYRDGDTVPPGYHVEDRPRNGLVVGGWTLLLVPYGIGAVSAIGTRGDNATTWLYAPVVGPWFVLGDRRYSGCGQPNSDTNASLGCVGDVFAVMGLIVDGALQAAGATLLLLGYTNPKHVLVPDEPALRIVPMRVGSGEGVGLTGTF